MAVLTQASGERMTPGMGAPISSSIVPGAKGAAAGPLGRDVGRLFEGLLLEGFLGPRLFPGSFGAEFWERSELSAVDMEAFAVNGGPNSSELCERTATSGVFLAA